MPQETTANPPIKPHRGPVQRLNLPLSKQATDAIKQKARLYPGQQGDFVIRLAKRYEAEHLAADLMAIVQEKEAERKVALGLEEDGQPDIAPAPEAMQFIAVDPASDDPEMVVRGYVRDGKVVGFESEALPPVGSWEFPGTTPKG